MHCSGKSSVRWVDDWREDCARRKGGDRGDYDVEDDDQDLIGQEEAKMVSTVIKQFRPHSRESE